MYKVLSLSPNTCEVTLDAQPAAPEHAVFVRYKGPDAPLHTAGGFALPPYVQEALQEHFLRVNAPEEKLDRILLAANTEAWVVPLPSPPESPSSPQVEA